MYATVCVFERRRKKQNKTKMIRRRSVTIFIVCDIEFYVETSFTFKSMLLLLLEFVYIHINSIVISRVIISYLYVHVHAHTSLITAKGTSLMLLETNVKCKKTKTINE